VTAIVVLPDDRDAVTDAQRTSSFLMILALFTHVEPLACVSRIQGCSIDRPGLRLLESDLVGGEHDSFLQMPVVPPEYRSGDYIYR
jgi:hypothetical protein